MKRMVKRSSGRLFRSFLNLLPSMRGIRLILMYHRVLERAPSGLHDPAMFVTKKTFDMHLKELTRYFEVVDLDRLLGERPGRGRLCSITFDDGWRDNYEIAFPLLKSRGVTATIFIPAEYIGSDHCFWWERVFRVAQQAIEQGEAEVLKRYFATFVSSWKPHSLHNLSVGFLIEKLKALPADSLEEILDGAYTLMKLPLRDQRILIDWREIEEMGAGGLFFGSHGLRHAILTGLTEERKREEIFRSREMLGSLGSIGTSFFSYPNGNWDSESIASLSSAGYRGALTTRDGFNTATTDPFLLSRLEMHEYISSTPGLFWFRIHQAMWSGPGPGSGNRGAGIPGRRTAFPGPQETVAAIGDNV